MGIICYITFILFFVLNELKILNLSFFDMFVVPIFVGIVCTFIFGLPSSIERVSKQNELDKNVKNSAIILNSLEQTAKDFQKKSTHTPNPYRYEGNGTLVKDEDDGG